MATRINPPVLTKGKNYERFKQELLAWREITELRKDKQGIAIALSLPEDDESQIREKVFDQIPLQDLKRFDGLTVLLKFLDQHLAKDDLTDSLEKFEDFEDFSRSDGQSINEYVAIFDAKYRKIEKKNMSLPAEILAFKLLRKANISKEEKLLVLTGMNYDNKATLYEEAKKSLKKFKGNDMTSGSSSIKLEPGFLAANEEALLAAGYSKTRGYCRGHNSSERCEGRCNEGNDQVTKTTWNEGYTERGSDIGTGNAGRVRKKINPKGVDGKILVCKSCGSYRHLLAACPDSWENMGKVNMVDKEHFVLFTGFNSRKIQHIGNENQHYALLDSACSSTVCGERWLKSYINSLDSKDRAQVSRLDSRKSFKFGGGTCLRSKGEYYLPAVIAGKYVLIRTDVVESYIPLLLSRTAMKRAAMKLDIENDTAIIMGKQVALNLTSSGLYCIPIQKTAEAKVESVCIVNQVERSRDERDKTYRKPQRKFAEKPKMSRKFFSTHVVNENIKQRDIDATQLEEYGTAKQAEVYVVDETKKKTESMIEKDALHQAPASTLSKKKMNKNNWFLGRVHSTDFMTDHKSAVHEGRL